MKTAAKINTFYSKSDNLEINSNGFSVNNFATFAAGKNKKVVQKKLAKQEFDFLYDKKKGGLYFN